jgi:hypothetical protein
MRHVSPQVAEESFLNAFLLESLCLREFYYFIRRHVRYLLVFVAVYRYSLFRWRATRIVRVGFCLAQHVDDVLDGDRNVGQDPEAYVRKLLRQIEMSDYDCSWPAACMAKYVMAELGCYQTATDDPRSDLLKLFEVMLYDRRRINEHLLLSGDELTEHHRQTFYYSLNIALIIAEAELRADDAADLIGAFIWCSPLRDLREDLEKGLVNIPRSVIEQAQKQGATTLDYQALSATPAVRKWMRNEYHRGREHMNVFAEKLKEIKNKRGAETLSVFLHAIQRYAKKYLRKNRELLASSEAA